MDVSVLVSWKTTYRQVAWSVGDCLFCKQLEAVRIEDDIQVVSIWFIPIVQQVTGQSRRCDFCERPIDHHIGVKELPLPEWSPAKGLDALVGELIPSGELQLPDKNSDRRLHSLLGAAADASSINNVDITFGITTGILLGIAVCLPLGIYLFDSGSVKTQLDRLGFAFASILTGIGGGAVIGAIVHAIFKRGKVAFRKIHAACENYALDIDKLEELSQGYGGKIRRAVRAVREHERKRFTI